MVRGVTDVAPKDVPDPNHQDVKLDRERVEHT